jgi:hypothetical protein
LRSNQGFVGKQYEVKVFLIFGHSCLLCIDVAYETNLTKKPVCAGRSYQESQCFH